MILFKAEAILASSISKFGKFVPAIDREDFNSSIESTISTSLIYNIASEGKSEQVVVWFLNLIFQPENDDGVVNLSKRSSDICCLCCPTRELCGISTDIQEFMVDGLLANVGIEIVLPVSSSSPAARALCKYALEPHLWPLVSKIDEFLDKVFVMTRMSNVDLQKRFPVVQIDSMCQVASVCRRLA